MLKQKSPSRGSLGICSGIGGSQAEWRVIAGRALACAAVVLLLVPVGLIGQQSDLALTVETILHGFVRDAAGGTVADARVTLRGGSSSILHEEITDAEGQFTFRGVATGQFTVSARKGSLRSATVAVSLSTPGAQPAIDLVLGGSLDANQPMQFADQPDFAIAAVTDWTAAGGHGSDSSLRTSEALTREAVNLKPGSSGAGVADTSGGGANEDDLARALKFGGSPTEARDHVRQMLASHETADLHRMDGELDEKLGDALAAVQAFQKATQMDPSEENYFAWGSELLVHRAVWQAKEVFDEGTKRYPQSARMLTARGVDLFAGALYDEAALDLCRASDLNPESPEAYLFMGKIEIEAPNPLPCVVEKLARFERLEPANSLANYYYAMALKKQQGHDANPPDMEQVKDLLTRAVTLDPKCAEGFLELGNLSAGQKQWARAIELYLKGIEADPDLSEAHYRLGVAYERAGDQDKAKEQFELHDSIAKRQAAEVQLQREAVKQFLVVLPNQAGTQPGK